jgi:hypothetical protein
MSSPAPSPLIWFLLVDSVTGQPYKGTTADKVSIASTADVADFRDAVKKKDKDDGDAGVLNPFKSSQLLVYKNKASFDKRNAAADEGKEEPLKSSHHMDGLGETEEEALIVVVPSSESISQSASEFSTAIKQPHPKRKQRWIELNAILEGNSKKSKMNDSMAYSNVTWNQVKSVFNPTTYVQPQRHIDDAHLDFFGKYLSHVTKCLGIITTGKEAKRLHFIAPILICVCVLFDGDVDIVVEEDLVGNFVKAHGHFEFMMRRGNKAVCIVEAKKDDVEQGMAQDLVGCEVASEVGGLDIVYGVVTNYMQWNFLRSLNDKVEIDEHNMDMSSCGPERHSIKKIAEKIYDMLSDE